MKNETPDKDLYVTIILSESTASLLNLSLPHLDHIDPENSRIFLISPSDYSNAAKARKSSIHLQQDSAPGTSRDINGTILAKYRAFVENKEDDKGEDRRAKPNLFLRISSDVALFSKTNCSSNSSMYEGCNSEDSLGAIKQEHIKEQKNNASAEDMFEARKIRKLPLVSVRSVAHKNKLNAQSNDLYIALLDSNSDTSDHICRICHGGESLDDLLMPCRCRGTVALVHLKCLERWLKDSQHSHCELCLHHYKTERRPRYTVLGSIVAYMREPGPHVKEILFDLLAFALYTPSAIVSTYLLMMMCESLVKSNIIQSGTLSSHILAFTAVFGMAAIDFTYTSWLLYASHRHIDAWRDWYNNNSTLKVLLPAIKLRPIKKKRKSFKEKGPSNATK